VIVDTKPTKRTAWAEQQVDSSSDSEGSLNEDGDESGGMCDAQEGVPVIRDLRDLWKLSVLQSRS
jgi:hypothetical protein